MTKLAIPPLLFLSAAALSLSACAGAPAPKKQHMHTQSTLHAAQEMGANKDPDAKLHLQLAKEQLNEARKLMEKDENTKAKRVLARAEADADLAIALTREEQAEDEAQDAKEEIQKLRKEEF